MFTNISLSNGGSHCSYVSLLKSNLSHISSQSNGIFHESNWGFDPSWAQKAPLDDEKPRSIYPIDSPSGIHNGIWLWDLWIMSTACHSFRDSLAVAPFPGLQADNFPRDHHAFRASGGIPSRKHKGFTLWLWLTGIYGGLMGFNGI